MASHYFLPHCNDKPKGRLKRVWTFNADHGITIYQRGKDNFAIQYGVEVDDMLTYAEAAHKFGEALFHAMACGGTLDNGAKK